MVTGTSNVRTTVQANRVLTSNPPIQIIPEMQCFVICFAISATSHWLGRVLHSPNGTIDTMKMYNIEGYVSAGRNMLQSMTWFDGPFAKVGLTNWRWLPEHAEGNNQYVIHHDRLEWSCSNSNGQSNVIKFCDSTINNLLFTYLEAALLHGRPKRTRCGSTNNIIPCCVVYDRSYELWYHYIIPFCP